MTLPKNSASSTRLISNTMCPFAQKAWIALECSQTPYEMQEVSLYGAGGKPGWFLKLNPQGTVPVLVSAEGVVLPDSDLILDALENGLVPTQVNLLPRSDIKPQVHQWRKRINSMLPIGKRAVLSGAVAPLRTTLKEMDQYVVGPYLTGSTITSADCHAFPFLWRLEQEFGLRENGAPNLATWLDTVSKEAAFQKTIKSAWWWWW